MFTMDSGSEIGVFMLTRHQCEYEALCDEIVSTTLREFYSTFPDDSVTDDVISGT